LDTHKVAAILTMLILVIGYAMIFGINELESAAEERAAEKAVTLFSEDEIQTTLKVYEFIDKEVKRETAEYGWLGYVGSWLSLCGIAVAIISGITAFSIPKRYKAKLEGLAKLETPKFLLAKPEEAINDIIDSFEIHPADPCWKLLIKVYQEFRTGNRDKGIVNLRQAISDIGQMRGERAKEIKEKLETLVEILEKVNT